jgi:hypothetical protein
MQNSWGLTRRMYLLRAYRAMSTLSPPAVFNETLCKIEAKMAIGGTTAINPPLGTSSGKHIKGAHS